MKIKIFDTNKEASGCECSCSSAPPYTREDLVNDLQANNTETETIIVEDANRQKLIDELNEIFESGNERITVNENTLDFTLSKVLPLIVADYAIKSAGILPGCQELLKAVKDNTRIKMKSSSC